MRWRYRRPCLVRDSFLGRPYVRAQGKMPYVKCICLCTNSTLLYIFFSAVRCDSFVAFVDLMLQNRTCVVLPCPLLCVCIYSTARNSFYLASVISLVFIFLFFLSFSLLFFFICFSFSYFLLLLLLFFLFFFLFVLVYIFL